MGEQLHPTAGIHGPLTRYVKLRVVHAPGMPETFSPPPTYPPPLVSDPGMHHGTFVTHMPWCMPGSLTSGGRKNVPGISGACATHNLRIWQEAHGCNWLFMSPAHLNKASDKGPSDLQQEGSPRAVHWKQVKCNASKTKALAICNRSEALGLHWKQE